MFSHVVTVNQIRIYPTAYENRITLRFELYGCEGKNNIECPVNPDQ